MFKCLSWLKSFSALALLVGRQEGHPACKNWVVGAGVVICLERDADLHLAQLMPLPLTVSCFSKIQIGFTFLVPGSPGQRAIKRVCVCVCLSWLSVWTCCYVVVVQWDTVCLIILKVVGLSSCSVIWQSISNHTSLQMDHVAGRVRIPWSVSWEWACDWDFPVTGSAVLLIYV